MLSILFNLDDKQYALDSADVIEVTPLAALKKVPSAPFSLSGLMNYRGKPLPVIDICIASLERPCKRHMNSRIIITNVLSTSGVSHTIGLLVENVVGMVRHEDEDIVAHPVNLENTPHLENIYMDKKSNEMIQYVNANALLTEEIKGILSKEKERQGDLQHVS